MLKLAKFRTPSQFEREYLRNGWKYLKSVNLVHYSVPSRVQRKSLMNFGILITEI